MKLSRRQAEAVNQIIKEEVDGTLAIHRERERLLDQSVVNEALEGKLVVFIEEAIDDLVIQFARANRWNPSIERDFGAPKAAWDEALRVAKEDLRKVVSRDVRDVGQALAEGMYAPDEADDDVDDELMAAHAADKRGHERRTRPLKKGR
jgi:hypothetical protein